MNAGPTYTKDKQKYPLVSFIITDYNVPPHMLRECMESLMALALSADEREIIIIDDGSDVSPLNEIIDLDPGLIYLRQQNQGLSAARNRGMEIATGKYIQFVDADDLLIATPYNHCLDLARYHNADLILFRSTCKENANTDFLYQGPVSGTSYMRHNNISASACGYLFRRGILGNLRFHEGILHEDEEFTPQLLLRAEHVFTTEAQAYFYRKRQDSIMHKKSERWILKRLNDTEEIINTLRNRANVMPVDERTALQRRIEQLTMDYIYNVIVLTKSEHYLNRCLNRLRQRGLFPLPEREYTRKYKYFCRMANNRIGRKLLIATLPRLKDKE